MKAKAIRFYANAACRDIAPAMYADLMRRAPTWANHLAMCSCWMCSPEEPSRLDRIEHERTRLDLDEVLGKPEIPIGNSPLKG